MEKQDMDNTENIKMAGDTKRGLGKRGLIFLISVLAMTPPLSTDMYLPALPHMSETFDASTGVINLTLVAFFFFLAVGILLIGPASDRYGRKPMLLMSLALYSVFSLLCAFSFRIEILILARVFQALGGGGMMAISTALVKDCFEEKQRGRVLAVVQAMSVIAPMAAPLLGALILSFFSWRATFLVLFIIGAACFIASLFMEETLRDGERSRESLGGTLKKMVVIAGDRAFLKYLLMLSLFMTPYMAYIGVCSYIYIDIFRLSNGMYSVFFAVNSAFAILGPILYVFFSDRTTARRMNVFCLAVAFASGVLLLVFGHAGPVFFLLSFLPFTVVESMIRPLGTEVLLRQKEGDTGAVSSLINFAVTVFGSVGMVAGTLPWPDFIVGLGVLMVLFAAASALFFIRSISGRYRVKDL